MSKITTLLFFCTISSIVVSFDAFASKPSSSCYAGKLPLFQIIDKTPAPDWVKSDRLYTACDELDEPDYTKPEPWTEKAFNAAFGTIAVGLTQGDAIAAFARLDGSEAQRDYKKALDRIRKIENPLDRIQSVYDLAARASGSYDYDTNGNKSLFAGFYVGGHRPGNLIDVAKRDGSIGVCREYAALLSWSLLQVARGPGSKAMALGPKDFSASLRYGFVGGGHAWVQAHLPQFDSKGALTGFVHMDLDSTWYGRYSPLFPRRALSEKTRKRAVRECSEIKACLGH